MQHTNYFDALGQLESAGLVISGPLEIDTHKIIRCKIQGEREARGWYRLHTLTTDDNSSLVCGVYGVWRGNESNTTKIELPKADRPKISKEQWAAIKAQQVEAQKRAEAERLAIAKKAAARASNWWRQMSDTGASPYLERKGFAPGQLFGARISPQGNLAIPMLDTDGAIWGLQVIYHDPAIKAKKGRDKDFAPLGLAKKGHFVPIGSPMAGSVILICEGFATGASLHQATGLPVIVAFDAGNLLPVAKAVSARYKRAQILICADDDYLSVPNTGVQQAQTAAMAVNGAWVAPVFDFARSQDKATKGPTDYNDLHTHPEGGLHVVRAQIDKALTTAGFRATAPLSSAHATPRAGDSTGGAGERPVAVSQMTLDDIVRRFVFVDDGTGDYVWDEWTRELCKRSKIVNLLPARVRFDDVKDHPVWQTRAVYLDQVGFDPSGQDENIKCNRFRGWPMTPKAGKCEYLLDTLSYYAGNEMNQDEVLHWMLCWLAYPLQNPGAKMQSAMVIHGPQGTGKSRFFEAYAKIFGEYATILNQGAIEDKFNSDWTGKLFVVADEIVARQDLYHIKNQLKALITGDWVRVNTKNMAAYREKNHMNLVFLSNELMPVLLENDDRRHLVLWTPPTLDVSFYDGLSAEIDNGGIEALYHYLLHYDVGDFKPWTKPPMTKAKADLQSLSSSSEERFVADWHSGNTAYPVGPVDTMTLYGAYLVWCRENGVQKPRDSGHFLAHVARRPGFEVTRTRRYENDQCLPPTKQKTMVIPEGATCSPDVQQSVWLTKGHVSFLQAMEGARS